ncbi:MAG: hypothetical protein H0W81_11430 [Chloroflexi bacterium]|nr:hypothetical protein [Chloroflexota bacterium]
MSRRLAAAISAALLLLPLAPPFPANAAEYEMATVAEYAVDPAAAAIAVTISVKFTNTLPDPPGQISAFTHVDLAIQDGASGVAASDDAGPLPVAVQLRNGVQVASVATRSRVRSNASVSFTLTYRLADGAAPGLYVRAGVVKFPAWGFGTSSQVTVRLPVGFEAVATGDPLETSQVGADVVLTSGPIPDPGHWLAVVTAVPPPDYVTQAASVPLASGTVDLQVRAWRGDAPWGERTLTLLTRALPVLEQAIRLPYSRVGPLVVSESAGGEPGTAALPSANAEIQVAFDGSAFTLLHQAAHVWIGDQLAADRWVREGLASHYAAGVATRLAVEPPYDPAARARDLASDAMPLVDWVGDAGPSADTYGYAASWALVDRIATAVGEARLAMALRRIAAGLSAYDPTEPDGQGTDGRPFPAADTRRLLDQLAAVSSVDVLDLFRETVFEPDAAVELAQRDAARVAYRRLLTAAGDWGAPDQVRAAMSAWRFDEAQAQITQASVWLAERDALFAKVDAAGLVAPDRLRDRYVVAGGGPDASAELEAESALVDAYAAVQERTLARQAPLEAIGLLLADDPRQLLAEAADDFAQGDLRAAAGALDRLELQLNGASSDGAVRLAAAVVLLALVGLALAVALRRRSGSHYTAAG